ncbi:MULTISPECIES: hypothetical protein [Chryseobacterium]|uniref:Uncharacterized protein n=1 Tax=Chryseobacterium geocarposphaerae TaxID=1416776 RepID=A0ABU1LDP2_9FLAO|nr:MULTISPECIES: hypothetical protein [Chryseobacterium]MDR6404845.1 hypothetical protein [Chryseobacterium geocarposphaerae]MDR6697628.1 hypothetical protein [Chryseobacterium ginsenosidimutans]
MTSTITDKDLEILYYITPQKYRTMLDGESDPKTMENLNKEEYLEELLLKSSLNNLITTIVKIFKNKYANPMPIWTSIVDYEINTKKENSKRNDIKKLKFDFQYGVENDFGGSTQYLDNLFIEFAFPFQNFKSIIKTSLQGKSFTENSSNNKTVFTINNSPILKIEITDTSFLLFIDKNSFIDYGQ